MDFLLSNCASAPAILSSTNAVVAGIHIGVAQEHSALRVPRRRQACRRGCNVLLADHADVCKISVQIPGSDLPHCWFPAQLELVGSDVGLLIHQHSLSRATSFEARLHQTLTWHSPPCKRLPCCKSTASCEHGHGVAIGPPTRAATCAHPAQRGSAIHSSYPRALLRTSS